MKTNTIATPHWSTASFGHTTDTTPVELEALEVHLDACKGSHGRLLALQYIAQQLHGFVTARFVTTLVLLLAVLIGISSMVL